MQERPPLSDSETLQQILVHLERMDKRDRIRTWGGMIRSAIAIVPVILFLLASWYAYYNIDAIIKKISEESAKQAAKYTEQQSADFLEQMKGYLQ